MGIAIALRTGVVCLVLALVSCSGGGSGGGGSSDDAPTAPAVQASGWIGGGQNGWHTAPLTFAGFDETWLWATDVAVDSAGFIYVADDKNLRVSKWAPDGTALGWIGWGKEGWQTGDRPTEYIETNLGMKLGSETDPRTIWDDPVAVDGEGNIYKAPAWGDVVSKWDAQGRLVGWIGGGIDGWQTGPVATHGHDYRSFANVHGLAVDADGNIYAAEPGRVSKWSRDGVALGWIGGGQDGWQTGDRPEGGPDYRRISNPWGIFLDADGSIYVADSGNWRIQKWSADGTALGWIGGGSPGWKTEDAPGRTEDSATTFNHPYGIWVDADGSIYVTEREAHCVTKWDRDGNALGWIGNGVDGWQQGPKPVHEEGGSGPRDFDLPTGVAVAADGTIIVSDFENQRLVRWSADGRWLAMLGGGENGWRTVDAVPPGDDIRSFRTPGSIALDASGNLYVSDRDTERLSKWTAAGVALGWIGGGGEGWHVEPGPALNGLPGMFWAPRGLCVDLDGFIYVADEGLDRVTKWSPDGRPLGWIGGGQDGWRTDRTGRGRDDYGGEEGTDRSSFRGPTDVCVDADGIIYVVDRRNHRVCRWAADGTATGWIGDGERGWNLGSGADRGHDISSFERPEGITRDSGGNLLVTDVYLHRVSGWTPGGEPLGWLGAGDNRWHSESSTDPVTDEDENLIDGDHGRSPRRFTYPGGLATDASDRLYVADEGNHRLTSWSLRAGSSPTATGWIGHGEESWQLRLAPKESESETWTDPRRFVGPRAVCVDRDGNIYVADGRRVSKWSPVPGSE